MRTVVATEGDEDYVAAEDDEDYVATEEEDDEYGYLTDNLSTDYDDEELESMIHFDLLKVSAADFKALPPDERECWLTAHFIIQKHAYMFKPRKGEESKQESKVEESKVEQVSKEEESKVVVKEEDEDIEEESKVVVKEEDDEDVEEESKVPKTNDYDGASGPRGTSLKRSSKPGV